MQKIQVSILYRWGHGVLTIGHYEFETTQQLAEHLDTIGRRNVRTILFNN
jgi:hypothetical protein